RAPGKCGRPGWERPNRGPNAYPLPWTRIRAEKARSNPSHRCRFFTILALESSLRRQTPSLIILAFAQIARSRRGRRALPPLRGAARERDYLDAGRTYA